MFSDMYLESLYDTFSYKFGYSFRLHQLGHFALQKHHKFQDLIGARIDYSSTMKPDVEQSPGYILLARTFIVFPLIKC